MALTDKLTAIADAIRSKTGTSESLTLDAMVTAIDGISAGITPTGDINITENGEFDVTEFAKAIVNVASGGGDMPTLPFKGATDKFSGGTFTTDGTTSLHNITVEHNLGRVPVGVLYFMETPKIITTTVHNDFVGGFCVDSVGVVFYRKASSDSILGNNCSNTTLTGGPVGESSPYKVGYNADNKNITLGVPKASGLGNAYVYRFKPSTTYSWLVW